MDCHLSRLMLAFRRSDLTADDAAALDAHLATCSACAAVARRDVAADRAFASAMTAVPVPSGLHTTLLTTAARRESVAWRHRASKWVGGVAAVLAVAVAVGAWEYVSKPTLDTAAVAVEFDQKLDFAGDRVPNWLQAQGLSRGLLDGFDLRLPVFTGRSQLLGREVPTVMMVNGPHVAQIYLVPPHRFHIDPAKLNDSQSSRGNVTTIRRGGVVMVIVTTSDSLAPFLTPPTPAG
jgi:Putative zinc-finger